LAVVEERAQGSAAPRIRPGGPREIGRLNYGLAHLLGAAAGGGGPPHLFTTLARHRRLFRRWLRFAGALMPGGLLPRTEAELVILRVAHNTGCEYEERHHRRLARVAGLREDEVERVKGGWQAAGWTPRQAMMLRAADELHADGTISGELWGQLRPELSDAELIELCMLVGHYEMLAMTLRALAVQPDPEPAGPPPRVLRLARRAGRGPRPAPERT
jgi:AhpD family alkylhydroperoxidase